MEVDEFGKKWLAMERRLDPFAERADGVPWWDVIRYRTNEYIFGTLTQTFYPPAVRRAPYLRILGYLRRLALKATLTFKTFFGRYDVVVLRAARQSTHGQPLDPGVDALLPLCGARTLIINTHPIYYHLPRRAARANVIRLGPALNRMMNELRSEFGGDWDENELRNLIERLLSDFCSDLAVYRRLFRRIRPRLIVLTQNGIEKALFVAAHALGIPVIEVQHGLIGMTHAAYSYPRDVEYRDASTFPSVFFAYSDYWIRSCFYPAGMCVPIGNDHVALSALPSLGKDGPIMFISADLYNEVLMDWAKRLATALPDRHIVYKLHPNQQTARHAIEREFRSFGNVEVADGSTSARALFHRVAHVVLIQSTVAHEALQSGRRLCVLPLLHYRIHQDLFELAAVTVTPDLESLIEAVRQHPASGEPPRFFDRFDVVAARTLLSRFLGAPAANR